MYVTQHAVKINGQKIAFGHIRTTLAIRQLRKRLTRGAAVHVEYITTDVGF